MKRTITIALILLGIAGLAACHQGGSAASSPVTFSPSSAEARASAAASQIPQADINLAKGDVSRCVTGTPLQQIHTVHVTLLERAGGKNGTEVTATRARVFGCLGVPPGQRTQFRNDSLTAAEKQVPHVWTKAGIKTYVLFTWPALLAKYQHASPGPAGSATASPAKTGAAS